MIKLTKEISGWCEENSSISDFPSMQYKQNRIWMQMEHVYIYTVFIIAMFSNISTLEMCTVDHCGHKKFKIFPKKYWPKWSDQMIKYIFQTLKNYFGQYGQTIFATTKTLRFYNGHNGLTEFTCKNSDWIFFHMSKQSDHFGQKLFGRSENFTVASLVWPKWPL